MIDGFSKINYKGKEIFLMDFSGFSNDKTTQKEKTIQLRKGITAEYFNHPPRSVLTLLNVTNLYFDMDVLNTFKEESAKAEPYEKKSAIVGVKGLLKAGYNFVVGFKSSFPVKLFDSIEEAKEWLVSD